MKIITKVDHLEAVIETEHGEIPCSPGKTYLPEIRTAVAEAGLPFKSYAGLEIRPDGTEIFPAW